MKHAVIIISVAAAGMVLISSAGGCYTTKESRQAAAALAKDVGVYKQQQKERVDKLNATYQERFGDLVKEFTVATYTEALQQRDAGAQRIADQLIDSKAAPLRQKFRDAFATRLAEDRQGLYEADAAINAMTAAYQEQYRALSLQLAEFDAVQSDLLTLAADENQLRSAADFVQTVLKVYNDLKEQAKKEEATNNASPP
jgi:hypothetical protein